MTARGNDNPPRVRLVTGQAAVNALPFVVGGADMTACIHVLALNSAKWRRPMTLKSYARRVRLAALLRDGEPLYNGSIEHATVLASALFEHSSSEVSVFSGKLNAQVFGKDRVIERARIFLSTPERKVRIIVESPDDIDWKDHPFIKAFGDNSDVEIKGLSNEYVNLPYHFMVMDQDSYRFEEDKNEPTAIASFGDKVGGKHLTNIFNTLWNSANDLN